MRSLIYKGVLFATDILLVNIMFLGAMLLRFEFQIPQEWWQLYLKHGIALTVISICIGMAFKIYKAILMYASIREIGYLILSNIVSVVLFFVYTVAFDRRFPRSVYIIYMVLLILGMIASRLFFRVALKVIRDYRLKQKGVVIQRRAHAPRTLLVGAGEAANLIVREVNYNPEVTRELVVAVDDALIKIGGSLGGVPVRGKIADIPKLVEQYEIEEILIAIPTATKKRIGEIVQICTDTGCKLKIFPGISKSLTTSPIFIRNVNIEDLLGRDEIVLDNEKLNTHIVGKTILVTGGGGSIGSELCRQIAAFRPKQLVIFDIYENNAYDIQNELIQNGIPRENIHTLIGSVRDKKKLKQVFSKYKPNIVFHAAAHKHVPLMETSPEEAIKNNVFGTLNVARCAREYKAQRFVLISTDKAVNPTNVMGATKRICEMIIQAINQTTSDTDYVAVRFGNVLGSNGSVIPLFKRQLEAGGPLTVTHPEIIRYFMTIPEAVRLILQAMSFAEGGEIFVLDMGEPVKIYDLARNFIKLSGLELGKDIDITFTGLRPGEKLYEELLMSEEGLVDTGYEKIFIGQPGHISYEELKEKLSLLSKCLETGGDVRETLMQVVPTYSIPEHDKKARGNNKVEPKWAKQVG